MSLQKIRGHQDAYSYSLLFICHWIAGQAFLRFSTNSLYAHDLHSYGFGKIWGGGRGGDGGVLTSHIQPVNVDRNWRHSPAETCRLRYITYTGTHTSVRALSTEAGAGVWE